MTVTQAQRLRELARDALGRHGVTVTIEPTHLAGDGRIYPLNSLAVRCSELDASEWPAFVESYLAEAVAADRERPAAVVPEVSGTAVAESRPPEPDGELEGAPQTAPQTAEDRALLPKLRWQLYSDRHPVEPWIEAKVVTIAPGLTKVATVEEPDHVSTPTESTFARLSDLDLDVAARAGLRSEQIETHEEITTKSGATVHLVGGTSMFIASKVLIPGDLARLAGAPTTPPFGILFCAPSRHLLAFHLIRDETYLAAALDLWDFGRQQFTGTVERPISPDVYWSRAAHTSRAISLEDRTMEMDGQLISVGSYLDYW
ncbi:hypothetical protein OG474_02995 [Kribbella sp. NBC_01505]|uniref:hypothetical protein n=1 Tax=Kribbella sp. NBC_01505 TaxID=2903580 RepID=UPI0038657418